MLLLLPMMLFAALSILGQAMPLSNIAGFSLLNCVADRMLGDTGGVFRPHHHKARAEKEGSCVGVAGNVEELNHL